MVAKGFRKSYVWEVSWKLNRDCNILTTSSFVFSSTSFSFCRAAQPEALRAPALCWHLILTASNCIKLTPTNWTSCRTWLYHCLRLPASCERCICTQFTPSTVKVISWYLRPGAPVPLLTAWLKVNMLHMGQIELLDIESEHKPMTYNKLNCFD